MPRKNYYLVLGVPRGESADRIRAAYRELAKRHHPDVAGPASARRFGEIAEAYSVLSDARRRRRHDADLDESDRVTARRAGRRPASRQQADLTLEVVLTPEEAARGGVLPVDVPVIRRCPVCFGSGRDWLFPCQRCGAHGLVESRERLRIEIPPGIGLAATLELSLRRRSGAPFRVCLHLVVERTGGDGRPHV